MPPDGFERLAQRLLREAGFISRQDTVVLVDLGEEVRTVQRLGGLLATAGIPVLYSYSSVEAGGHTVVVFKTVNTPARTRQRFIATGRSSKRYS